MDLAPQKGSELIGHGGGVGDEPRRGQNLLDVDAGHIAMGSLQRREQIPGMKHADDIVRPFAPHREAAVPRLQDLPEELSRRACGVEAAHLGTMDHHIEELELLEVENAAQHVEVDLAGGAAALMEIDGPAQLVVNRAAAGGRRIDAEKPEKPDDPAIDGAGE